MDNAQKRPNVFGGTIKAGIAVVILLLSVWSCGFSGAFTGNSGEPLSENAVDMGGRMCPEFKSLVPADSGASPVFDLSPSKPVVFIRMPDGRDTYFIASYRRVPKKKKCVALEDIGRNGLVVL